MTTINTYNDPDRTKVTITLDGYMLDEFLAALDQFIASKGGSL